MCIEKARTHELPLHTVFLVSISPTHQIRTLVSENNFFWKKNKNAERLY